MDFRSGRYAQPHANSYGDTDPNAYRKCSTYCNTNGYCYCDCHGDSNTYSYTDGNNASAYSYTNRNADGYAYTYSTPNPYTTVQPGSASASDSAAQTVSRIGEDRLVSSSCRLSVTGRLMFD